MNYTYLLRCADGSLYCGWTNHLTERIEAHNTGKGAKYTKGRGPVMLVWSECFYTKEEAMKREAAVKKLKKAEKEALVLRYKAEGGNEPLQTGPMRIIVSPAKKMQARPDDMPWERKPVLIKEAEYLLTLLKKLSESELKTLFQANDSITHENYQRYRDMNLHNNLSAAVLTYIGIQYQYMSPHIFSGRQWEYVCRHLRILSGFYGVLRADDGIVPYRLEMQAALKNELGESLYHYWGDKLYRALTEPDEDRKCGNNEYVPGKQAGCRILNLASKEYSKAIEPYLRPEDQYITCIFGTDTDGKVKVKATEAKMARGEMVRFLAETEAESFSQVKKFDRLGFSFCPEKSTENEFVFIKGKEHDRSVE